MLNIEYQQKDTENKLQYIGRLVKGKLDGIYDLDYTEFFDIVFNAQLSSNEARKRFYSLRMLFELLDEEELQTLNDDEVLDKIKQEKYAAEKEKIKTQTEKIELRNLLRESARNELTLEKIENSIRTLSPIKIPNYKIEPINNGIYAIGGIADAHYGKEILIKGLRGEILNEYNPDIFEKRMWTLLDKYITKIEKENINHLHFYNLGDDIDGILRISQLQSLKYGIIESTMKFSEFMANFLNELSKYVYVDYFSVMGNHSEIRPLASKSGEFFKENVELIINWYLSTRLKDNPNVKINSSDSNLVFNKIGNYNVLATHGQNDRDLDKAIVDYSTLYDERIDLLLCGHWHTGGSKTAGTNSKGNIDYIQFPSICGIDDFSMKIKKSCKAGSKLILLEGNEKTVTDIILN